MLVKPLLHLQNIVVFLGINILFYYISTLLLRGNIPHTGMVWLLLLNTYFYKLQK